MKILLTLITALVLSVPVLAETASCSAAAAEKKLAGAAKTSFLKKCVNDATAQCELKSLEKKLAGAAKTSFEKKCIKDAVGAS